MRTARPRIPRLLALAAALLAAAGCDGGNDRLRAVATLAASPTGGRSAAAAQLVKLMAEDKVTYEQAVNEAWNKLDALPDTPAAAGASVAATEFAGAVLDAIAARQSSMQTAGEYELFWMRVGGLAFKAAEEAHARGRTPEARSLIFAGGDRWQHDAYWNRRPDHDALAAMVLAETGSRAEAVSRLQSRADLQPPATEVLQALLNQR